MTLIRFFFLLVISSAFSCQALVDAPVPSLYWEPFDSPAAKPLPPPAYAKLEGMYRVLVAADDFGDSVAVKWTYDVHGKDTSHYLSFFCREDVRYFILQAKSSGDSILLNGYWRNVENTKTGKAHFVIRARDGAFHLVSGTTTQAVAVFIDGHYGLFDDEPKKPLQFRYSRPLHTTSPFQIIAHRGGGRNNDLLPASENSVEMIHLASRFGANGIEIDVQLTKDGVPVLYHDGRLNDRLTRKTGIQGALTEYTYAELEKEVELKRGGKIPTLQDALYTAVYETPLRFVWLDCKTQASLQNIRLLRDQFTQKAKEMGRSVEIVIGVPDETVLKNFLSLPGYEALPSLCELKQEEAQKMKAKIWATSWTKGLQQEDVTAAQQKGMRAFAWTLDVPRKIREFMREGHFNGIVTNRPSAVAYEYYCRP